MRDETDEHDEPVSDKALTLTMVSLYRTVMKSIMSSSYTTLIWGGLLLALWYYLYARNGMPKWGKLPTGAYIHLGVAIVELFIGLWERFFPSLWCMFANGLLLLGFASWNGYTAWIEYTKGGRPGYLTIALGVYMTYLTFQCFKNWWTLRKILTVIPTREQLRWFDGLVSEVKTCDPETDSTALRLNTTPEWRAKLLGDVAFFVDAKDEVVVTGPYGVAIDYSDEADSETMNREAMLFLDGEPHGPFLIDGVNIRNYRLWKGKST